MNNRRNVICGIMIVVLLLSTASHASDVISAKAMKIRFGYCPYGMMETPVAKEKAFYKKYLPNVEIEWHFGLYSLYLINDWLAGKIEVAYLGDMPSIVLQNRARNTKWVGVAVYPHGQVAGVMVPHNSPVKDIKELDGKNVATGIASSHHRIMDVIGAKEGVKFKIVNRTPERQMKDIQTGKADAACFWPPYLELAKHNKIGRVLLNDTVRYEPEVNAIWPVVVSEKFAKEHPDIVKGIVKADIDLHKFMRENPDEASQIVYKSYEEKIPLPVVRASLASYRYSDTLDKEHIETMQRGIDFLKSQGIIKTGFNAADWADPSFTK
ncbi:ABC transporter substrate-binding protein [Desulfobacterales bacterium HSG2]|nr:ABC transporter substrate-binding protein [Desulfobacterales bacterium HSG2]